MEHRLEKQLGKHFAEWSLDDLRQLIAAGLAESNDVDFKAQHYASGNEDKRKLATAIAAFANTEGGCLFIGVSEDKTSNTYEVQPVSVLDAEVNRYSQILNATVSPYLPARIHAIVDDTDPASGVLVITVARSTQYPHAVVIENSLKYPRRSARNTSYMTEFEVGQAYSTRLQLREHTIRRLTETRSDFLSEAHLTSAWLIATAVPLSPRLSFPSAAEISTSLAALRNSRAGMPWEPHGWDYANRGFQMVRLSSDQIPPNTAKYRLAHLHDDGALAVGSRISWPVPMQPADSQMSLSQIDLESVISNVLAALKLLNSHASNSHSLGPYLMQMEVCTPTDSPVALHVGRPFPYSPVVGHQLVPRKYGQNQIDVAVISEDPIELTKSARQLVLQICSEMGLYELSQITEDGRIAIENWATVRPEFRNWANTVNGHAALD